MVDFLTELRYRIQLQDLVAQYSSRVDRKDAPGVAALFTEDAVLQRIDQGEVPLATKRRAGRAEIAASIVALDRWKATTHFLGQHLLEIAESHASGELYCFAHHIAKDTPDTVDHVVALRYVNEYVRQGEQWLFASRILHADWTQTSASSS